MTIPLLRGAVGLAFALLTVCTSRADGWIRYPGKLDQHGFIDWYEVMELNRAEKQMIAFIQKGKWNAANQALSEASSVSYSRVASIKCRIEAAMHAGTIHNEAKWWVEVCRSFYRSAKTPPWGATYAVMLACSLDSAGNGEGQFQDPELQSIYRRVREGFFKSKPATLAEIVLFADVCVQYSELGLARKALTEYLKAHRTSYFAHCYSASLFLSEQPEVFSPHPEFRKSGVKPNSGLAQVNAKSSILIRPDHPLGHFLMGISCRENQQFVQAKQSFGIARRKASPRSPIWELSSSSLKQLLSRPQK